MQSQHLHLQSVESQQMHPRQQPLPHAQPHHAAQQSHHHPFQIHQLQHQQQHHAQQRQHQHAQQQHHQQQQHAQHQSHHQPPQPPQPHPHQHQHQQPQHQHQQQHPPHQQQQQLPASHSQHHLSALHLPHAPSPLSSLALNTSTTTPFPVSTAAHPTSQFAAGQSLSRDNNNNPQPLPPQSHHSHFPLQPHNLSQQPPHHQTPASTNAFASVQPLQMQPLLPSQQPSQPFGNLANLSGSMLQAVDDTPTTTHHFANSSSGDALTSPYTWDPAHSHGALASQTQAQQQQPLLPIPLVGDTRSNNPLTNPSNQSFPAQSAAAQNSFGGSLNANMGVLGSSLNTTMVSGLVNGNSLGPNVAPSLSPSGTDLSQRNSFSISDGGAQRPAKTIKKARGNVAQRKSATARGRIVRGPVTSPVSTATLPNMSQPSGVVSNTPIDHPGVSSPTAAMASMASSPTHAARQPRGVAGGKAKGRMRVPSRGMDGGEVPGPVAMSSNTSVGMIAPNQPRDDPAPGATAGAMPGALAPQNFGDAKNATTVAWSTPKKTSTSRTRNRRKGDGTTTSLPVHLRNPKKGRARVFRECKACRHENHIRRSDCSNCKAPLPAGKRRRDGNPSYDAKRQGGGAAATAVANTHMVATPVGRTRPGVKDDIAVSSVMSK